MYACTAPLPALLQIREKARRPPAAWQPAAIRNARAAQDILAHAKHDAWLARPMTKGYINVIYVLTVMCRGDLAGFIRSAVLSLRRDVCPRGSVLAVQGKL